MAGDYTELYVDHGGSDLNGGSSAGVVDYALAAGAAGATATDNGADSNIEDLNNGSWAGVTVDMTLCFDTGGAKQVATVTAINVGADPDVITVSPQVTAAAQKGCNVGGAFLTINRSAAVNIGELAAATTTAYPPCVNIAADAAYTEDVELQITGTLACPFTWQGYKTVPRDYDTEGAAARAEVDGDGLSNYTGTWDGNAKSNFVLRDLYIHGDQAGIDGIYALACSYLVIHRCKVLATSATADSITVDGALGFVVDDCWVTDAGRDGLVTGSYGSATNNRIDSAGRYGIRIPTTGRISCRGNIVNSSVNHGIYVTNDFSEISHNYIYDSGASGIYFADLTSEWPGLVSNNIFDNCGSTSSHYGIEVASGQEYLKMIKNNAFFDCGDDVYPAAATQETQGVLEVFDSVTLTDSPATTPGTDFRLKATGGGLQCKDTGFPGIAIWAN